MPAGFWGSAAGLLPVTISPGVAPGIVALARCASVSASTSARPASSSAASTRRPFFGPSGTCAGLVPKNVGALATALPSRTVKCSDM